jgi:hypothetical protein
MNTQTFPPSDFGRAADDHGRGDIGSYDGPASVPIDHGLRRIALALLVSLATLTSIGIAAVSGWQRGGALLESGFYVALAVVAVVAVHLLPALCREVSLIARVMAAMLWLAILCVVLHGQMSFFMLAQLQAGNRRADTVPEVMPALSTASPPTRNLAMIAQDQEKVRAALAVFGRRSCLESCASVHVRQAALVAKLDALAIEADESKRRELTEDRLVTLADRAMRLRDSMRDDPVTARLAVWTGLNVARLNFFLALVSASVADGIASLGWYLLLPGSRRNDNDGKTSVAVTDVWSIREHVVTHEVPNTNERAINLAVDCNTDVRLVQLMRDVAEGKLQPTVSGIRNHVGCAQETALKLRRQLQGLIAMADHSSGGRHVRK